MFRRAYSQEEELRPKRVEVVESSTHTLSSLHYCCYIFTELDTSLYIDVASIFDIDIAVY